MTLNEAITEGLLVTFTGLIIVFSVLAILMLVLMVMKSIFCKTEKKEEPVKEVSKPVADIEPAQNFVVEEKDDLELVAVISAAIAMTLNVSSNSFVVKSYRRIKNNSPAWNRAGVTEMINTRY